jgi:hypothetical protein
LHSLKATSPTKFVDSKFIVGDQPMQQTSTFWRYKIRPFNWDDLYAVQALINVIAQHEQHPYYYSLEWLYYVLNQPNVNAERNCFVALLETGRVIGYSRVESSNDVTRYKAVAGVHSDFRRVGVGQGLITINDFNLLLTNTSNMALTATRQSSPHNLTTASLLTRMGYTQTIPDENNYLLWEKQLR